MRIGRGYLRYQLNAMYFTLGIFTTRPGIYFFSFTGLADFPLSSSNVYLQVGLYWNGGEIGMGDVGEANTVANQNPQVTVQSTLNMKKGDQVWVQIRNTLSGEYTPLLKCLADDSEHRTYFTWVSCWRRKLRRPSEIILEMRKMIVDKQLGWNFLTKNFKI